MEHKGRPIMMDKRKLDDAVDKFSVEQQIYKFSMIMHIAGVKYLEPHT